MGSNVVQAEEVQTHVSIELGNSQFRPSHLNMILWLDSLQPLQADALDYVE